MAEAVVTRFRYDFLGTGPGYAPAPSSAVRDRVDAVCRHLQQTHTEPVDQAEVAELVHRCCRPIPREPLSGCPGP